MKTMATIQCSRMNSRINRNNYNNNINNNNKLRTSIYRNNNNNNNNNNKAIIHYHCFPQVRRASSNSNNNNNNRNTRDVLLRAAETETLTETKAIESYLSPHPPTVLTAEQIMSLLPHRYPFLLVDKIVDFNTDLQYCVGIKNVTMNDNFFPGHFPDRAIMPGVLQVEALAQVGGVLMMNNEVGGDKSSFFFGGIDKCKFRKPVVPGDTLLLKTELTKLRKRFGIAIMKGEGFVNGEKVVEAEMTMYLGKAG